MRIFIITMDDPVYTVPFIKEIINARHKDVIGVATSKGDRMLIGKKRSPLVYLLSLLLIMGPVSFLQHVVVTITFKIRKKLSKIFSFITSPSVLAKAASYNIPVFDITTPNSKDFISTLKALRPDVIINQSQSIIKKELLAIPTIGTINRHNALLPKNRGRLTPFWVLFHKEKETGVSIHFVTEGIDAGEIIVQAKFDVSPRETFNSLVRKNYVVAPKAMLKALEFLEAGDYTLLPNDDSKATYNSVPTFNDALNYRLNQIKKIF